jgi:hypothetical protein
MEAAMVGRSLPVYLYGIHDPGPWRERFRAAGVTGWVIFEETIGADPEDLSGRGSIYPEWADAGFGVIVVLNHGRYPNGTLPSSDRYEAFARRCARFVAASPGAHIWIIGNEPNHPQQQPGARLDPAAPSARPRNGSPRSATPVASSAVGSKSATSPGTRRTG